VVGGALYMLLMTKKGREEKTLGQRRLAPFNVGGHGSDRTLAGASGRHMRTRPAPNRGGRVPNRWARGHSNGRRRFELDPNANSNEFKQVQIFSNFDRPKKDFALHRKIEIKYGCEGLERVNNFLHRNFFRFRRDLE
jgi:hypothetical protein